MGEVVVSSIREAEEEEEEKKEGSAEVVRWERFLPRMVLRVLLVEADDSTRQIIAALLRKCSYRVAAVPDGLKAWETLKGRPHNIDLVLTEVELPSISGYALLTLVTEHDVYKNIPVIMMSSQDSMSMVLNCMLKGAADFLIKPVRRNELRNLWQHIWRRHTLCQPTGGHLPQNLAVAQHKVEATSENNAASNHSSDYVASLQKNKECSEKGIDAQCSCTTPYLEAESACMQNMQGFSQMKHRSPSNLCDMEIGKHEECDKLDMESIMPGRRAGENSTTLGSVTALSNEAYDSNAIRLEEDPSCAKTSSQDEGVRPECHREKAHISFEIHGCNEVTVEPSNGAIDLIGKFDSGPKCSSGQTGFSDGTSCFGLAPQLELSLRRFCPSSSKNQGTDEGHPLNHSDASAFSWYNNCKTWQPLFPTLASNSTEPKEGASNSHKHLSNQVLENTNSPLEWHGAGWSSNQENTTLVIGQSGQVEAAFPSPQLGLIPVAGVRSDSLCAGYGHFFPPLLHTQTVLNPVWSNKPTSQREQSPLPVSSSCHSDPEIHNFQQGYRTFDENTKNSIDQSMHEQGKKLQSEELRHSSPSTGQRGSSSLCNVSHINSSASGSICNRSDAIGTPANPVAGVTAPEGVNDNGLFICDGFNGVDSCRLSQREAALTKFRMKRKDRCYEKKVRYHSRNKLAEQRPRVKGQFVRQVQPNYLPAGARVCPCPFDSSSP